MLAEQVWDIKGMVQNAFGAVNVPVGTADTWTAWVEGDTRPVIEAVDVVIMNAFPVCSPPNGHRHCSRIAVTNMCVYL